MHKDMFSINRRLTQLREQLKLTQEALNGDCFNPQLIEKEKLKIIQLEKWERVQEQVFTQKSRANWIAYGDSNSKHFHAYLKARHAKKEYHLSIMKPT